MGYKYKTNHEYFNNIDTEYKAYILGLLYADGCISQPKGNRQLKLCISLQEEDGYILDKLASEVIDSKVIIRNPPAVQKKGWKKRATVTIISNSLCNKLISYGCKINKSRVGMLFPDIEDHLIPHFVRGFMDGDGSVIIKKLGYKYKRKKDWALKNAHTDRYKLRIAFSSTDLSFLETIAEYLPIEKFYISYRKRTQLVYTLWIERTNDVQNSIDYLYKDASYYFKRKRDKVEEFNKTIKSQADSTLSEGLETT